MKLAIRGQSWILTSLLFLLLTSAGTVHGDERWLVSCRQIVLVSSESWEASKGEMALWQKKGEEWFLVRSGIPISLGRNGMGVGVGLHQERKGVPVKKEGDRRAPAGVFPLEFGFGRKARPLVAGSLAFRRATDSDFWVDDPDSEYYNQWVDRSDRRVRKDWSSAEILARKDGLYDLAIVVGHNRDAVIPGRGSAIFIHCWRGDGIPTIGCTAMDPGDLLQLWKWLKKDDAPLLVQGPARFLRTLKLPAGVQLSP